MSTSAAAIYDIEVTTIAGVRQTLDAYRGRALLIVNVASRCGFTPQYAALESLHRTYAPRGFSVLGFPCDQFGRQEPGTDAEIAAFCAEAYQVTFPLFSKIDVNGPAAHPLYRLLKSRQKGLFGTAAVKWNFTKFLVDREGVVVGRYGSHVTPQAIEKTIQDLLS